MWWLLEIVRAVKMGFCLGVEEAVNLAHEVAQNNKDKSIYILGMLVHNEQVIIELEENGIKVFNEFELEELKKFIKKNRSL